MSRCSDCDFFEGAGLGECESCGTSLGGCPPNDDPSASDDSFNEDPSAGNFSRGVDPRPFSNSLMGSPVDRLISLAGQEYTKTPSKRVAERKGVPRSVSPSSTWTQFVQEVDNAKMRGILDNYGSNGNIKENRFYCKLCGIECTSAIALEDHRAGRSHQKKKGKETQQYSSSISTVICTSKNKASVSPKTVCRGRSENNVCQPTLQTTLPPFYCTVCETNCTSSIDLKIHKEGKPHKRKLNLLTESNAKKEDRFYCKLCNIECTSAITLRDHLAGRSHQKKENETSRNRRTT